MKYYPILPLFFLGVATTVCAAETAAPAPRVMAPAVLPGKGPSQHDFLYAGEWDTRKPEKQSLFLVRGGKIVWSYSMPLRRADNGVQEFDDATLLPNGNVVFSRMSGAGEVNPKGEIG